MCSRMHGNTSLAHSVCAGQDKTEYLPDSIYLCLLRLQLCTLNGFCYAVRMCSSRKGRHTFGIGSVKSASR